MKTIHSFFTYTNKTLLTKILLLLILFDITFSLHIDETINTKENFTNLYHMLIIMMKAQPFNGTCIDCILVIINNFSK